MHLGNAFNNVEGFDGLMDDAFLWDGSLTPGDIAFIASVGVGNFAVDADGDGLPNAWEIGNGLDPNIGTDANGAAGGLSFTIIAQVNGITTVQLFDIANFIV